jgi:hypothetical protein
MHELLGNATDLERRGLVLMLETVDVKMKTLRMERNKDGSVREME